MGELYRVSAAICQFQYAREVAFRHVCPGSLGAQSEAVRAHIKRLRRRGADDICLCREEISALCVYVRQREAEFDLAIAQIDGGGSRVFHRQGFARLIDCANVRSRLCHADLKIEADIEAFGNTDVGANEKIDMGLDRQGIAGCQM